MKIKRILALAAVMLMLLAVPVSVYATDDTPDSEPTTTTQSAETTKKSTKKTTEKTSKKTSKKTTTTTKKKTTKKTVKKTAETEQTTTAATVSAQSAGGTVVFKSSNSKRVPVGKSTTLYLTIADVRGVINTDFTVNDATVASIQKINNQSVKVTGIKEGNAVVTATVAGRTAQYKITVGNSSKATAATTAAQDDTPQGEDAAPVDTAEPTEDEETNEDWELDLFSSAENDQLAEYIKESKQSSAGDIIMGIIGFAAIFGGFGLVLAVIFRNRTPKLNLYPGSRRRFNTGGYKGRRRKRLLPDSYYRRNKKY